jgi:hypothetical protein
MGASDSIFLSLSRDGISGNAGAIRYEEVAALSGIAAAFGFSGSSMGG